MPVVHSGRPASPHSRARRGHLLALLACGLAPGLTWAQAMNTISPADLKKRLEAGDKPLLLDIQPEADFSKHHLPGATPTYAYPAKSAEDQAKLKPTLNRILAGKEDVVIVCPAGGGGAKNTYEFLKSQGVPESRMRILEKGQRGWPYAELVQQGK